MNISTVNLQNLAKYNQRFLSNTKYNYNASQKTNADSFETSKKPSQEEITYSEKLTPFLELSENMSEGLNGVLIVSSSAKKKADARYQLMQNEATWNQLTQQQKDEYAPLMQDCSSILEEEPISGIFDNWGQLSPREKGKINAIFYGIRKGMNPETIKTYLELADERFEKYRDFLINKNN